MKTCKYCKIEKEEDRFPNGKGRYKCRDCTNEYARKLFHKHKEKFNENRRKYYETHKENQLARQKEYYKENRDEIRRKANARNKTPEEREKANARSRKWARENKERHYKNSKRSKERNPERQLAHQSVMWALRLGFLIKPDFCSKCERKIKVEGHHTDYKKPLEVIWLCRTCHLKEHGKLVDVDPRINDGSTIRFEFSSYTKEDT